MCAVTRAATRLRKPLVVVCNEAFEDMGVPWMDVVIAWIVVIADSLLLARPGSCSTLCELHWRLLFPA